MEIAIGSWTLRTDNYTLYHAKTHREIDLERGGGTSSGLLDWLWWFRTKEGDGQALLDLMAAFEAVVDPQANLCSYGRDKQANVCDLVKEFEKRWKKAPRLTRAAYEAYEAKHREMDPYQSWTSGTKMIWVWVEREFTIVTPLPDGSLPDFEYLAPKRKAFSAKERFDILERDGFRCKVCGATADEGVKLHVDHIKPVSKGGDNHPSNLQTLCEECNLGKGDRY